MGYLGSQDTFYVGTLKGVGRVYQQTFIDTYSAVGFCKLYTSKHPQTNGICARFNKTCLNEFYQIVFRKKVYHTMAALQEDRDAWLEKYNTRRTHQGKRCQG